MGAGRVGHPRSGLLGAGRGRTVTVTRGARSARVPVRQVDAVVDATRTVGALIAESLAAVEPPITMPQWRVLVLASESPMNASAVAQDLGIHQSNATRICDRLVKAGLLDRRRAEGDRRQVVLTLTQEGRQLYETAMSLRRARVERAMALMSESDRSALAAAMTAFSEAAARDHNTRL